MIIESHIWNKLVEEVYKRPYNFQQQEGCKERGIFEFTVPSEYTEDNKMNESIPEEINGELMGVKFEKWLERDPTQQLKGCDQQWELDLFWERNFYPDIYTLANDLHKRGLLEKGTHIIRIDW